MCAELEKEEEEGHYQRARQDMMEEAGVGICWTRKGKMEAPPGTGKEETPSQAASYLS